MNNEKLNCCGTDNTDCNTQETNCCTTEKKKTDSKKRIGLGILLFAITFAAISAFTPTNINQEPSCTTSQESCNTSCETGKTGTSCCSKK